jgi:hypothetical protein
MASLEGITLGYLILTIILWGSYRPRIDSPLSYHPIARYKTEWIYTQTKVSSQR